MFRTAGLAFCLSALSCGAMALLGSATFGIPVSTTHTITGAIVGVGSARRMTAVRWGVARRIVVNISKQPELLQKE